MQSFLIKIGKVIAQIKNIGIFNTGKKIITAFFYTVWPAGAGDILFITNGTGDSARYRTWHVAEELENHGFKCSVTVQDNFWLSNCADKFKIFVLHRTLFTPKIAGLIEKIKKQNKEIIFDADDLLFDPEYFASSDYSKNANALEKKLYKKGLGGEILKDPYVKACTTTTSYLADILKSYGKTVFIVPNKLSNKDLEVCNNLKTVDQELKTNIRIGYFSGTLSHNRDFAVITDALMQIMKKYPSVELFLAGPLDIESRLHIYKERIKQLPYVPRAKYFVNIASVDINLAPLEIGDPFCEAKSELKIFEAGILGIPTVASATRTFKEAIQDGEDGFVAGSTAEWIEKVEKLISDENLRQTMGEKARTKTLERYTNKNSRNEEYYGYLRVKLKSL